jgi:ankyrin repeat protein
MGKFLVETSTEEVFYPIHDAARRGNLTHLMQCLAEGVSATSLDNAGNTALYWSSHSGQVECVKELLTCSGPAINAQVCSINFSFLVTIF